MHKLHLFITWITFTKFTRQNFLKFVNIFISVLKTNESLIDLEEHEGE